MERTQIIRNEREAIKYINEIMVIITGRKNVLNEAYTKNFKSEKNSYTAHSPMWLLDVINLIGYPLTIVCESYYVDKVYRDSYYMYFSNKHIAPERYCYRLSFFKEEIDESYFLNPKYHKKLKESFVGACVIRPLSSGIIGRTLLSPKYILKDYDLDKTYIRTTKFEINVYGVTLTTQAFPYSMQDMETTTCAEIVLLNLLEYFSTRYSDYKKLLPSDIINAIGDFSHERSLPTHGLKFFYLGRVLKKSGFSPRLYDKRAMPFSGLTIKKIWHYYIESGIPVALGLERKSNVLGHVLIGIGHSGEKISYKKASMTIVDGTYFIDSADLYTKYVVVDDNQLPYSIKDFSELSIYPGMSPTVIAVPLAKRMFMEAKNAFDISTQMIIDDIFKIKEISNHIECENLKNIGKLDNPFIFRLFLTSARSFKSNKLLMLTDDNLKKLYMTLPLPRFVWCCEIYDKVGYDENKVVGEIVLDATSASASKESLILIKYYNRIGMRIPGKNFDDLCDIFSRKYFELKSDFFTNGYSGNLCKFCDDTN